MWGTCGKSLGEVVQDSSKMRGSYPPLTWMEASISAGRPERLETSTEKARTWTGRWVAMGR